MSNGLNSLRSQSSTSVDHPHISEPRSIRRLNDRSFASSASLSSSFTQRPPARSFVQHASFGTSAFEHAPITSDEVREQTAQLATQALSPTSSRLQPPHHDVTPSSPDYLFNPTKLSRPRPSIDSMPSLDVGDERRDSSQEPTSGVDDNDAAFRRSVQKKERSTSSTSELDMSEAASRNIRSEQRPESSSVDESTPLLKRRGPQYEDLEESPWRTSSETFHIPKKKENTFHRLAHIGRVKVARTVNTALSPKSWSARAVWKDSVKLPVSLLPCVLLGLLLNVLDALSYGMILFPLSEPIFAATGPDAIAMFYVSTIIAQVVYSGGGSIFKGAVGSQMIEVVPFFHKMAYSIMNMTGKDDPEVVLATTITAFAASSIITGLVFFGLGAFKLGSLVNFFPRHILIGCIGGVGFFLLVTGFEISARLDKSFEFDLETAQSLLAKDTYLLWLIPLLLAITLTTAKNFIRSPLLVPIFFVVIAGVFYVVVAAVPSLHIPDLRAKGWVFGAVEVGVPWYNYYSYYNFNKVDWNAFVSAIPAMFALTFFGILHVPINVPALAIVAEEDDVNLNRELVAHGVSNALSGFIGSVQNYLVYANSGLFILNGGNNRLAGMMLAAATIGVMFAGPGMIGYVPIMVVASLIFYLGIDLLSEALYEPWRKMNKLEYLTVVIIVLTMGIYDFVNGILVGIVLASLFYVVDTSSKSAIRATYSGAITESTVRRHAVQRHFLQRAGRQIYVTKLAGTLFFGSIVKVEKQSRALIEEEAFREQPIRFLIFDFSHVNGLDYSAAEAFTRMQRVLGRRDVRMIMCGVGMESEISKSFRSVGLWRDDSTVQFFENLNLALENCENQLLSAFYRQSSKLAERGLPEAQEPETVRPRQMSAYTSVPHQQPHASLDIPSQPSPRGELRQSQLGASVGSPRTNYLAQVTTATLDDQREALPRKKWSSFKQPLPLILHSMQGLSDKNEDFWFKAVPYFEKQELQPGNVLFHDNEAADAFYLLEKGILRATYDLPMGGYQESILAGTTCGELPFFSDTKRTATVVAESGRDGSDESENSSIVVWALKVDAWKRLQSEWPDGARELLTIALRLTKERVDSVTGYVLTTAG